MNKNHFQKTNNKNLLIYYKRELILNDYLYLINNHLIYILYNIINYQYFYTQKFNFYQSLIYININPY